jgi:thiol-disulfide isomerase/thioredoxin
VRRRLIALMAMILAIVAGLPLERHVLRLLEGEPELPPVALDYQPIEQLRALPAIRFTDAEGHAATLADFRGRVVLLNLWATWCIPCRREMPALDRLQTALGSADFVVLPLAVDRGGIAVVRRFYEDFGLKALIAVVDTSGETPARLGSPAIPTTVLIGRDGREVGRQIGAAAWDGPQAERLLRRLLAGRSGEAPTRQ